jgi:hypothetical protein
MCWPLQDVMLTAATSAGSGSRLRHFKASGKGKQKGLAYRVGAENKSVVNLQDRGNQE